MSDFSFNPSKRSAFQRLHAASAVSTQSHQDDCSRWDGYDEGRRAEGCNNTSYALAGLERAVHALNESAEALDQARAAVAQVRAANETAAHVRISDVDRASELVDALCDQFGDKERRASRAHAVPRAAIQRLLG